MGRLNKSLGMLLLVWVALLHPLFGAGEEIETPEQLLMEFYGHLLSEKSTSELPQLFVEPTTFASALTWPNQEGVVKCKAAATKAVWEYLRKNKNLFLFSGTDPLQTVQKTRLNYTFRGFRNAATFFDGLFCVELIAPLSRGGKEGVYKQIRFPLKKNDDPLGPRYLIQESMITINGVILDLPKEFERTGNLYQQLGFIAASKP